MLSIKISLGILLLMHIQCASKNHQQSFQSPQTTNNNPPAPKKPLEEQLSSISSEIVDSKTTIKNQAAPVLLENKPKTQKKPTPLTIPQKLLQAIQTNDVKLFEELIEQRANIHGPLLDSLTPLHIATLLDKPEIVKLLIRKKVYLDAGKGATRTALQYAAAQNNLEIFQILMDAGAEINVFHGGLSPLAIAAGFGYSKIVKAILASGKNVFFDQAIKAAIYSSNANILEDLLRHGAKVEAHDLETAIRRQAQNMYYLERLIATIAKSNPDIKPQKIDLYHDALVEACRNNNIKAVKYLLEIGARINKHSPLLSYNPAESPLHLAAMHANAEILVRLLDAGAQINALGGPDRETPMHYAAESGNSTALEVLIAQKAKLNLKTTLKQTPLHLAAAKGRAPIVQQLKNAGAKLNSKDKDNKTALDLATEGRHKEVISILTP